MSRVIVLFASISITLGLYSQAIKIWETKSAKDFSGAIVFALLFNEFAWLNYGISLFEWPIILIGVVNVPAAIGIFWGYLRYRKYR